MIHVLLSPWAWVPLVLAAILCALSVVVGLTAAARSPPGPLQVSSKFFEGPGLTNSGAVSTVLSLLPLLLSEDVRGDPASTCLLGVATLLFSFSTFLGIWLYSTVAAKTDAQRGLTLGDRALIVTQGVIVWCMIVAAGCFVVFVLFTPLLAPRNAAPVAAARMTLTCDAGKCVLAPK